MDRHKTDRHTLVTQHTPDLSMEGYKKVLHVCKELKQNRNFIRSSIPKKIMTVYNKEHIDKSDYTGNT